MARAAYLLDVNSLLALAWPNHQFHGRIRRWFDQNQARGWSTCAITQLGFIKLSASPAFTDAAVSPADAADMLARYTSHPTHTFLGTLPPAVGKNGPQWKPILSHTQTTDAYLLRLAAYAGSKLVTFDKRLSALAGDAHLELLTTS